MTVLLSLCPTWLEPKLLVFSHTGSYKLKKVQERALGFINNDYSSPLSDLLKSTNTQPLHVRRLQQMACEIYKIVNKMSPEYFSDLVKIKSSHYNFRAERQAEVPRVNSSRYRLRSFRSEAARVRNSLPNEIRVADSYPQFRRLIPSWDLNLNLNLPGTPNTSKRVLHGVRAQKAVPKISKQKYDN